LEKNSFSNYFSDPLPDQIPIRLTLSACDVSDDAHHTAIREIQRDTHRKREQDFFDRTQHV
jgi:hypothetical protein